MNASVEGVDENLLSLMDLSCSKLASLWSSDSESLGEK